MVGKAIAKISGKIYLILIFIFLYAPIATLIVLSFNESRFRGKWGGFSLKWYESLFSSKDIMEALWTTLLLAFLSALIATILGTMVSFAMASTSGSCSTGGKSANWIASSEISDA